MFGEVLGGADLMGTAVALRFLLLALLTSFHFYVGPLSAYFLEFSNNASTHSILCS